MAAAGTASLGLVEREVKARYGCTSVAVRKEIVRETAGDRSLILIVTKFELTGHRFAKHCYAWLARTHDGREKVLTMLDPLG